MDVLTLAVAATPSFIASSVEFVEALTIVLAVGTTRGWRAPLVGAALAVLTLAVIVAVIGVALVTVVPRNVLQIVVGVLLLLFGLRWLRKAILRFARVVALHDEELIYQREVAELRAQGLRKSEWDWVGTVISYKSVLLEGLEVAFIVIAFGAGGASAMSAAIWGAIAAGIVVIGLGAALKHPLTQVPENTMKFGVGAMLTTFGVFWSAEGLGTAWPGDALSLFGILAVVLLISWSSLRMLNALLPSGAQVGARNV
jgi:uncharacterized membrane protein